MNIYFSLNNFYLKGYILHHFRSFISTANLEAKRVIILSTFYLRSFRRLGNHTTAICTTYYYQLYTIDAQFCQQYNLSSAISTSQNNQSKTIR